jgi:hypothetical protein
MIIGSPEKIGCRNGGRGAAQGPKIDICLPVKWNCGTRFPEMQKRKRVLSLACNVNETSQALINWRREAGGSGQGRTRQFPYSKQRDTGENAEGIGGQSQVHGDRNQCNHW